MRPPNLLSIWSGYKYNEKRGYIFVFQKTGIITKPKQTECNVNSYNKDREAFCKCECPDLIKQTGDEELHYTS